MIHNLLTSLKDIFRFNGNLRYEDGNTPTSLADMPQFKDEIMHTDDLILYQSDYCPFCIKVQRFLDANNIQVTKRDTLDPAMRQELINLGGKGQVPALRVGDAILYESNDIIHWFQQNMINVTA